MKFLDKLLEYYNLDINEYNFISKKLTLSSLPLFTVFDNIDLVTNKILDKIKNNKKILVYGDYDADGVLATSILVRTLKTLNADVSYYIPSRYIDSYGLNEEKVRIAKEKGFDLIITVDNGVKCIDSIKLCKELDIDIIITDHHEFSEPFVTDLFLHPKHSKLSVPTSGAVVSFYLSYSLLKEIDPYLLSLAAISIISDMMPLTKENRDFVRLALYFINKYKYRQLTILSGFYNFDENILSMYLISKINGVGRICQNKDINLLVKYFISEDFRTLYVLKDKFNEINNSKKELIKNAVNDIDIKLNENDNALIIKSNAILGLGSLLANKYLTSYGIPIAVFINDNGKLRGSLRCKPGCNLIDFLNENKDLFIEYGGHKCAAGVCINLDKFDDFKIKFNNYFKGKIFKNDKEAIDILSDEINFENYEILRSFSPFGEGFEEPTFLLNNINFKTYILMGKEKEHLKIDMNGFSLIWFNYDKKEFENIKNNTVNLYGKIKLSTFKDNKTLQFQIIDYQK